jgi:hypothetical protein
MGDKLEAVRKHVLRGRRVIERQKLVIARYNAQGRPTAAAEQLLDHFQETQADLEAELARLQKEEGTTREEDD